MKFKPVWHGFRSLRHRAMVGWEWNPAAEGYVVSLGPLDIMIIDDFDEFAPKVVDDERRADQ